MRKTQIHWVIVGVLVLFLFNFIFFINGGNLYTTRVLISYIFIHISVLFILLVPIIVPISSSTHLFIDNLSAISAFHFIIQFIFGLLCILFNFVSSTICLSIHIIICILYIITMLINAIVCRQTSENEHQTTDNFNKINSSMKIIKKTICFVDAQTGFELTLIYNYLNEMVNQGIEINEMINVILKESHIVYNNAVKNENDEMQKHIAILKLFIEIGSIGNGQKN